MEEQADTSSQFSQNQGPIRRLDVLTAKRISQEIKDGIESVRSKFLSKRKNNDRVQYKYNVSAMVSYNKDASKENVNDPAIERAK